MSLVHLILLLSDTPVHSNVHIYAIAAARILMWHTNATSRTYVIGDSLQLPGMREVTSGCLQL
jgi:hypothetical protein